MRKRNGILLLAGVAMTLLLAACGGTAGPLEDSSADAQEVGSSETVQTEETRKPDESVSKEFQNALKSAERYASNLHMSKQGIYDQLTSEYGDQFPEDAAQYAVDNLDADWNANALAKAADYGNSMHMSKQGVYDQLISEYGEQFTAEEAQYAIDHVEANWKNNALEKAQDYQDSMSMSKKAIYDQLTSEYGEQFTAEEAQYAVDNLE